MNDLFEPYVTNTLDIGEENFINDLKDTWSKLRSDYDSITSRYIKQLGDVKNLEDILKRTKLKVIPRNRLIELTTVYSELITYSIDAVDKADQSSYKNVRDNRFNKEVPEHVQKVLKDHNINKNSTLVEKKYITLYDAGYRSLKDIVDIINFSRKQFKEADIAISKLWSPAVGKPVTLILLLLNITFPLGIASLLFGKSASLRKILMHCKSSLKTCYHQIVFICNTLVDEKGTESLLTEITTASLENTQVQFRSDTDLGHIAQSIRDHVSFKIPSGLSEEERTAAILNEINEYLESPEGAPNLEALMSYSSQLSDTINTAFDTLKLKVSPEVDVLASRINIKADEYIQKATAMSNINGSLTIAEPTFIYIDFASLDMNQISQYAQDLLNKFAVDTSIKELNMITLRYMLNKIVPVKNIPLSPGVLEEYANKIYDALYKKENELSTDRDLTVLENIKTSILPVFEAADFNKLKFQIFNQKLLTGKANEDSLLNAIAFTKFYKHYEVLDSIVDISDETVLHQFKSNIEAITNLYKLAYTSIALSGEQFKNTVVIGNRSLNQTKFAEFQAQGGTINDVFNYIRLYCNHNKEDILYPFVGHADISNVGVTGQSILEVINTTNTNLETLQSQITSQLKSIVSNSTKRAFEDTMKEYLRDIEANNSEFIDGDPHVFCDRAHKLIPVVATDLVRYEYTNIYDAVYSFYLKVWYPHSLVSNVYHKLGAGLINELSKSDTVDVNTINYAHFSVMTDILTEYITKTMVVPLT